MKILLDTHACIWMIVESRRLSLRAKAAIEDLDNEVFVSAATGWEITTKHRIGKLPEVERFVYDFAATLKQMGFQPLPVSMDHATRAGLLVGEHKDPFDRMLIAQALAEDLPLVSNDAVFDAYLVRRIW